MSPNLLVERKARLTKKKRDIHLYRPKIRRENSMFFKNLIVPTVLQGILSA